MNPLPMDLPATLPGHEIVLAEKENPRALTNMLPPVFARWIEEHLHTSPELFDKDEQTLYKYLLKEIGKQPTATDNRLRLKFWFEFDRAMSQGLDKMLVVNIIAGVCSKELFYDKYLKSPSKVAWLLCPPTGYIIKAEEALEFGLEQLRDILDQPHVVAGKFDARLADLKIKIVAMLDTRVKGAPVQRSVNVNLGSSSAAAKQIVAGTQTNMDALKAELALLRQREMASRNLPLGKPDIVDPT